MRTAAARGYDATFNRTSATGVLARSVTAAQARPTGLGYAPARTFAARGYDTTFSRTSAPRLTISVMSPAVDPANAQQVPIVVTQAAPVKVADSGFSWTAGLLGAGLASLVLLLAAITASRIRPRPGAQL